MSSKRKRADKNMISDLIGANRKIKQIMMVMKLGARKKRKRRWPQVGVVSLAILFSAYLITLSQANEQQQPSQLFLPATTQKGPISLVPRVNQKRLEEEVDGFIMQAQQNTTSSPSSPSKIAGSTSTGSSTTEQAAAVTFEPSTDQALAAPSSAAAAAFEDEYRIPIDVNRQQFVTHDQLQTNSSSAGDSDIAVSESKIQQTQTASSEETIDQPASGGSDHRGQQQQWLRAASKVSHVSNLLSGE